MTKLQRAVSFTGISASICFALTGCATLEKVLPARTAIPVECKEPLPERPVMPTELLTPEATVDAYVQAASAEIDRREGYEDQLRTALVACTKPLRPS